MSRNPSAAQSLNNDVRKAITYLNGNQKKHLLELKEFLEIPSVSTLPENEPDIKRAAGWLAAKLTGIGMDNVEVIETAGHPLVYADWLKAGADQPTLLMYGHYDVQPPDPIELWDSPPFKPTERGEYLHARGVSDDKGQLFILVRSLESYLATSGRLPLNVKVIFEGEEETSGASLAAFVIHEKDRLAADTTLISDTAMMSKENPSIVYGLRGICYVLMDIVGPDHDLHSGTYGGAVDNPLNVLGHLIAKLKDEEGRVLIPGFYDKVCQLDEVERELISETSMNDDLWLDETGAPEVWGEPGYSIAERLGTRPTLDVNGIIGGYVGQGAKTVLPSRVHAKISMRLVPDQTPVEIFDLFQDYIKTIKPPTVTITCKMANRGIPSVVDYRTSAMEAARKAIRSVFNNEPTLTRGGGSIPVVSLFQEHLQAESVLMGFGLPDDRIHSPNERFYMPNFYRGAETVIRFLSYYGQDSQSTK